MMGRPLPIAALAACALAPPTAVRARELSRAEVTEALADALRHREDRAVLQWSERLLARDDLTPDDRRWAQEVQVFAFERLWYVCDGAAAAERYLADWAETRDDRLAAVRATGDRMADACRALGVTEVPPPGPDPEPTTPTRGHGTLTASSGVLSTSSGLHRLEGAVEASLGLRFPLGVQLEGALGLAFEDALAVTVRPGLRFDLVDHPDRGLLQLRGAAHATVADGFFAAAVLIGLEWGLPLGDAWGLQFGGGALLWPEVALASFEGRAGVFYAF